MTSPDWPVVAIVGTERLVLEPLRVEHAEEMAPALADESLHEFIGGEPATLEQLRGRYAALVVDRSADGSQAWFNWIPRHRQTGSVVGTVQATLRIEHGRSVAELAWVVATPHQGQGYAS